MAKAKGPGRRHYSPAEVGLVVNFAPELSVECLRHKFYQQIRDVYGQLVPPAHVWDSPPAFEPYRFVKEDGSAEITLALNSFGYITYNYTGYDWFRGECLRLINLIKTNFAIPELGRVGLGLTYIMPFRRVNGKVPLEKLLRVGLKLPKNVPTNLDNLSIRFIVPAQEGYIDVLIERKVKKDGSGEEAVFLVLSHERTGSLPMEGFADYLDRAHDQSRDLFKNLTVDS